MSTQVTIGIDPGIDMCGVARFEDGILADVDLVKASGSRIGGDMLDRARRMADAVRERFLGSQANVVIEWPRVYMAGKSRGDNNDLLPLAAVAGAISVVAGWWSEVRTVTPDEWRYGQAKKSIIFARVVDRLNEDERYHLGNALENIPAGQREHVQDAVGIAMFALGRSKPRLVI